MQINTRNTNSNIAFREKYPIKLLMNCACEPPLARRSEELNLIHDIYKPLKRDFYEMIRNDKLLNKYLTELRNYIIESFPELKQYIDKLNHLPKDYHNDIVYVAKRNLGNELELKRVPKSKRP